MVLENFALEKFVVRENALEKVLYNLAGDFLKYVTPTAPPGVNLVFKTHQSQNQKKKKLCPIFFWCSSCKITKLKYNILYKILKNGLVY